MAAINDPTIALGEDFTKLSEPANFPAWYDPSKDIVNIHGYAEYFKKDAKVVAKPTMHAFLMPPEAAAEAAIPQDWEYHLALYNIRLDEWKDYEAVSRSAHALLRAAVEQWVWCEARDSKSPVIALKAIIKELNDQTLNNVLSDRARALISSRKLKTLTQIRKIIVDFDELYGDIYFTELTSSWAIGKISEALPHAYCVFVKEWEYIRRDTTVNENIFRVYRSRLVKYTDEHFLPEETKEQKVLVKDGLLGMNDHRLSLPIAVEILSESK